MSIWKNIVTPFFSDKKIEYNSRYHWIIDPGHGGMIDGVYQTEGKASPKWTDMPQYLEGVGNRDIAKRLSKRLDELGISHTILTDTFDNPNKDIPLWARAKKANDIDDLTSKPCILISIHSNGFSSERAHGWEVHTWINENVSDLIADVVAEEAQDTYPNEVMRLEVGEGEVGKGLDKDSNFAILRKTKMPAILTENFFHTNYLECKIHLNNPKGRQKIADMHANAILKVEKDSYIAKELKNS